MIIPSFTGFAPAPNTAQSYLGGVASAQKDREINLNEQQLAQSAQNASMALQQRQQALQMEQQQAMMRADIQKKQLEQETFLKQQEINIRQQYETQKGALEAAKVQTAHQNLMLKTAEVANRFKAQSGFTQKRQQLIDSGMPEQEASAQATREFGWQMGGNGSAMGGALRAGKTGPGTPGTMAELPDGMGKVFWNNDSHAQYIPPPNEIAQQKVNLQEKSSESQIAHTRLKEMIDAQKADSDGEDAVLLERNKIKMTPEQKKAAKDYRERSANIRRLTGGGAGGATAPEETAPNEVVKLYKGKRAIFNKDTKEFIRYE